MSISLKQGIYINMKQSDLIFTILLVPLDFILFILAGISAYALRTSAFVASWRPVLFYLNLPFHKYLSIVFAMSLFLIIFFALNGLYQIKRKSGTFEEFLKIFIAVSAGFIGIIIYIFFKGQWFDSRFIILAAWFLAIFYSFLGRVLIKDIQRFLAVQYKIGLNKILIVGNGNVTQNIIQDIQEQPALGYEIIKHLDNLNLKAIQKAVNDSGLDEIILANPDFSRGKILELIDFCEEKHLIFRFIPNLFQTLTANAEVDTLVGLPLIELKRTPLDGWGKVFKRIFDLFGSAFGLIVLSPLFTILALIIKADSPGPVFVKLRRVSQSREFDVYKFRSMIQNAEELKKNLLPYNERKGGPLFKMKNDPRVTRFGRFLRRTRLDEFPQLINVLKGEISLVGPRPHQPDEIAQYQKHHKKLLAIKAGITGMAQASGSSDLSFEEEVKLDTHYIENWSILMDLKILLKTFLVLFTDKSAC